jgi:cold shock CspA family protein
VTELERGLARRGTVTSFDEEVGLGSITTADGDEVSFHCIEIADGSRTIEPGTEVSFESLAKFGRWEAASIRP